MGLREPICPQCFSKYLGAEWKHHVMSCTLSQIIMEVENSYTVFER